MQAMWVYITAGSLDEARDVGRVLVQERLAACVNMVQGVRSLFWWEDQVQEGEEVAMICKTRADLLDKLVERVRDVHSYDCPCVVALPITGGNPPFIEWIGRETIKQD